MLSLSYEMKPICPFMAVDLLKFLVMFVNHRVGILKLLLHNMALMEDADGKDEFAKVTVKGFRENAIEHCGGVPICIVLPLNSFIATVHFFSRIARRMIKGTWNITSGIGNRLTMLDPDVSTKDSPWPLGKRIKVAMSPESSTPEGPEMLRNIETSKMHDIGRKMFERKSQCSGFRSMIMVNLAMPLS